MTQKLPPELTAHLTNLIRRVRAIVLARGCCAVLAVAVITVLAIMAVDAAVVLYHPIARWCFSLAGLSLIAATAWIMLIRPLARPLTPTRMARILETRHPGMQERISSAIELSGSDSAAAARASAELIQLLTQDAAQDLAGVRPGKEFTARTIKPFLTAAGVVLLMLTALFARWPRETSLLFWRAVAPHRELDTLQAAALQVEPGDILLLAGAPLRLRVRAPERHGFRAEAQFERAGQPRMTERMTRLSPPGIDPALYELTIPAVQESKVYRIRYGTGFTRPYSVIVTTLPRVTEERIAFQFPAYTGLPPTQTVGLAQAIVAVAGTQARIEADFDRPCAVALRINDLSFPGGTGLQAAWQQTLTTNHTGRWALALRDLHGFTNQTVWSAYTVVPDQPPEAGLQEPVENRLTLPPFDRLNCVGHALDDYGFSDMALMIESKQGLQRLPVKVAGETSTAARFEAAPDLQALHDSGIRQFRLFFRVADNLPPELGGPQIRDSRVAQITLDSGARTLREQTRETARRSLEEMLRRTSRELNEAANRVAEEKGSFDRTELPERAVQKLEEARQAVVRADTQLARAAQVAAQSPFDMLASQILDLRDQEVEPAFRQVSQLPAVEPAQRREAGDQAERALREAAQRVNELADNRLQEMNREQEAVSRLEEVVRREEELAREAERAAMRREQMHQWAARQDEAEQRLWQGKSEMTDEAFQAALEPLRQARETAREAARLQTGEEDADLQRQQRAATEAARAAALAEQAAEQALTAAEQAEAVATQRAATEALREAAEQALEAAKQAEAAAEQAHAAADLRQIAEQAADRADRLAIAERLAQAAEAAQAAAAEAAQAAGSAHEAVEARREARAEQAGDAARQADAAADEARHAARQAQAEAAEAAHAAQEQGAMPRVEEAGRIAGGSAEMTQRAAELAEAAAQAADAAPELPQAQQAAALDQARGHAEQARQVADEAHQQAAEALRLAREEVARLQQETQQAEAARQAQADPLQQAQAADEAARQARGQAAEAARWAEQAVAAAQDAGPLAAALAERMTEAVALADQAAGLAGDSAQRTEAAERADLGPQQERVATQQAREEAQHAAALAREAAALAAQTAARMSQEQTAMTEAAAASTQAAQQQAADAARQAEKATSQSGQQQQAAAHASAQQSALSARMSAEAAEHARQALALSAEATPPTDLQARNEAQEGQSLARQALELARQASASSQSATPAPSPLQQQAARQARQVAQAVGQTLEARQQASQAARQSVASRMGDRASLQSMVGNAPAPGQQPSLPVSDDWARFRGQRDAVAYETLLRQTPPEYRELVKQYFEELSREGAAAGGGGGGGGATR